MRVLFLLFGILSLSGCINNFYPEYVEPRVPLPAPVITPVPSCVLNYVSLPVTYVSADKNTYKSQGDLKGYIEHLERNQLILQGRLEKVSKEYEQNCGIN